MSDYLWILVWLAAMALFQHFFETKKNETVLGKKERRTAWWFAILVMSLLVYLAVNRSRYVGDTNTYIKTFNNSPTSISDFMEYYNGRGKDKWFYAVVALIHIFISKDYKVYFLILLCFQAYSLVKLYRKYSTDYFAAIYIFVTCGDYVSWMHNGTRQFTAVTICLLATTWMIEKKYIPAALTILLASQFHQTALLMIPIFFICIGKPWNKRTLLMLLGVVAAITFVTQFTNLLDTALEETQYENVVSDWKSWNDDGTNPIRVLVYSIPMIISIVGLRHIRKVDDPVINFCTNMSIVTTGLYLVSMVTSGIFIGRLPIYASLYSNGILLPWELKHMFNRDSSVLIHIAMYIGYLLLYFYQMHFAWGII